MVIGLQPVRLLSDIPLHLSGAAGYVSCWAPSLHQQIANAPGLQGKVSGFHEFSKSLGDAFWLSVFFSSPLIDLYSEEESFQTVGMSGSRQAAE